MYFEETKWFIIDFLHVCFIERNLAGAASYISENIVGAFAGNQNGFLGKTAFLSLLE